MNSEWAYRQSINWIAFHTEYDSIILKNRNKHMNARSYLRRVCVCVRVFVCGDLFEPLSKKWLQSVLGYASSHKSSEISRTAILLLNMIMLLLLHVLVVFNFICNRMHTLNQWLICWLKKESRYKLKMTKCIFAFLSVCGMETPTKNHLNRIQCAQE